MTPDQDKMPHHPMVQGLQVLSQKPLHWLVFYYRHCLRFWLHPRFSDMIPLQKVLYRNAPHEVAFSQMCQTFFLAVVYCSLYWEWCSLASLPPTHPSSQKPSLTQRWVRYSLMSHSIDHTRVTACLPCPLNCKIVFIFPLYP